MTECAMMIALGTILSYFTIFSLPMGGNITVFSQVPLILIGYRHGWKWGPSPEWYSACFRWYSKDWATLPTSKP